MKCPPELHRLKEKWNLETIKKGKKERKKKERKKERKKKIKKERNFKEKKL